MHPWTSRAGGRPEAVPLYATERNPTRATLGPRVAKIAELQGTPFMPWQRDAIDIAYEIDPADGGPWYKRVVVIVQRQAGKTTVVRTVQLDTCLFHPNATVRYTAQTKGDAITRLEHDFYDPISQTPLAAFLDLRVGSRKKGKPGFYAKSGSESIVFANGSRWGVGAVKLSSGHGPTIDNGVIDEAFAHPDARLEQSMSPATGPRRHAQLWIASAAGNYASTYLKRKVDEERSRITVERTRPLHLRQSRTMYLEYAAPEGSDREDPATWWACHPALGYTIDEAFLRAELEAYAAEPDEFNRPYLGWWPQRKAAEWVIPETTWMANSVEPDELAYSGEPVWSIDVAPQRDVASIGQAGRGLEGRCFVDVPDRRVGPPVWCVERLVELRERWGGNHVGLIDSARSLQVDLESEGFTVHLLGAQDRMDACGAFYDDAFDHRLRHVQDEHLTAALAAATKRFMTQEGGFVWTRGRSLDDITPLYAATVARHVWVKVAGDLDYDPMDGIG
ncbi:hypothetical protein [Cellulomonas timonensis]|uniref:hypothetical protein n=1 Tax=Cellulomonas timonensis TaxID=1689271 RepID=UPI0008329B78|nr:hypothetical protein [Cellulomonas timonensis]